jgi:hypothetical protein
MGQSALTKYSTKTQIFVTNKFKREEGLKVKRKNVRQNTCNVTFRRVRVTTVAAQKQ